MWWTPSSCTGCSNLVRKSTAAVFMTCNTSWCERSMMCLLSQRCHAAQLAAHDIGRAAAMWWYNIRWRMHTIAPLPLSYYTLYRGQIGPVWKIGGIGQFPPEFIETSNRNGTSWLSVTRTRSGGIGINILGQNTQFFYRAGKASTQ